MHAEHTTLFGVEVVIIGRRLDARQNIPQIYFWHKEAVTSIIIHRVHSRRSSSHAAKSTLKLRKRPRRPKWNFEKHSLVIVRTSSVGRLSKAVQRFSKCGTIFSDHDRKVASLFRNRSSARANVGHEFVAATAANCEGSCRASDFGLRPIGRE